MGNAVKAGVEPATKPTTKTKGKKNKSTASVSSSSETSVSSSSESSTTTTTTAESGGKDDKSASPASEQQEEQKKEEIEAGEAAALLNQDCQFQVPRGLWLSVLSFVVFLRVLIGFQPHSGQDNHHGNHAAYGGDFEAQRHWMEVTFHLPIGQWYWYDVSYWGLDYPPLSAYTSFLCGALSHLLVGPETVQLETSRGFEDPTHKAFMRTTVVVFDLLLYGTAVAAIAKRYSRNHAFDFSPQDHVILFLILFLYGMSQPAILLMDHGHFQYNTCALGLALWAFFYISQPNHKPSLFLAPVSTPASSSSSASLATISDSSFSTPTASKPWFPFKNCVMGSICFCLALSFKQMTLYYAPAIFSYLLGRCLRDDDDNEEGQKESRSNEKNEKQQHDNSNKGDSKKETAQEENKKASKSKKKKSKTNEPSATATSATSSEEQQQPEALQKPTAPLRRGGRSRFLQRFIALGLSVVVTLGSTFAPFILYGPEHDYIFYNNITTSTSTSTSNTNNNSEQLLQTADGNNNDATTKEESLVVNNNDHPHLHHYHRIRSKLAITLHDETKPGTTPMERLAHVLRRIIPLNRGLFEGKVSNLWCALSVRPIRIRERLLTANIHQPLAAFLLTLLMIAPSCWILFKTGKAKPVRHVCHLGIYTIQINDDDDLIPVLWGVTSCALGFFLASFQVHEKSILLALAPASMLFYYDAKFVVWFSILSVWTLWPLLILDRLHVAYMCLMIMLTCLLILFDMSTSIASKVELTLNLQRFRGEGGFFDQNTLLCILPLVSYTAMLSLHLLEQMIDVPSNLPDLFPVLWSIIGCGMVLVAWMATVWHLVAIQGGPKICNEESVQVIGQTIHHQFQFPVPPETDTTIATPTTTTSVPGKEKKE